MKIYFISVDNQNITLKLLTEACVNRDINYEVLNPMSTNPSDITIEPGDAVYRISTMSHYGAAELENHLIFKGAKIALRPRLFTDGLRG